MYLLDEDANYFNEYYGEGIFVAIQKPTKRILKIKTDGNLEDSFGNDAKRLRPKGNFYLSLPHVVFRITYAKHKESGRIIYAPESLAVAFATSLTPKDVYVPPLFNVDETLGVCIPLRGKFRSPSELCDYCIANFWKTEFNDGMCNAYEYSYADKDNSVLANYARWQKKTKENPNWIPTARSMEYYGSYKDFCEETRLPEVLDRD